MAAVYRLFNPAGAGKQFGRGWYLFARRSPHRISHNSAGGCWELPIATFPLLGLPIHSTFVFQWGMPYFESALRLSRLFRPHMIYVFHLLDLFDSRSAGVLSERVATLKVPVRNRLETVRRVLALMAKERIETTREFLDGQMRAENAR
jgi:hypothetical protein